MSLEPGINYYVIIIIIIIIIIIMENRSGTESTQPREGNWVVT